MKYLLTVLLLTFSLSSFSQKITLDQLLMLHNMEWSDAGEYLTSKGWELQQAQEPKQGKYGIVIWIHSRTGPMGANYWYSLMYSDMGFSPKSIFSTIDKKTADAIKSKIREYKMTKIASGVRDTDEIYSDYTGAKYAIRLSTVNDSGHQAYEFNIWDKNYYLNYIKE